MIQEKAVHFIFLFALFILLFAVMVGILTPFFSVILWSTFLYIVVKPLHKKCESRINPEKRGHSAKRHLLAGIFSVGTVLFIVGSLIFLGILLIQQGMDFFDMVESFIHENPGFFSDSVFGKKILELIHRITPDFTFPNADSMYAETLKIIQEYSLNIINFTKSILSGSGSLVLSIAFMIFILFFLFLDGAYLGALFAKTIPIAPEKMTTLMTKFSEITKHLFSGYVLIALYQGVVAFILMLIFKVPGSLLFSVTLMLCSFIPIGGTAIIWVPVGVVMIFAVSTWKGLLFLALSGVFISLADNFLRPVLLQSTIKIHTLLIFFAILGGIQFFGINGLLLGPMTVILFFTVSDMIIKNLPE